MEQITQKTTLLNVYERQICSKKIIVRFKVDGIKMPPPRRVKVNILFNDGTTKTAEAVLVSAYNNYAYYDLVAADAKEVYPHADKIQGIEVAGE
ncbi:MAG: hypothetical protein ACO2PN_11135 [Pyrobaculum sp.]|jgi:hypothetical protein